MGGKQRAIDLGRILPGQEPSTTRPEQLRQNAAWRRANGWRLLGATWLRPDEAEALARLEERPRHPARSGGEGAAGGGAALVTIRTLNKASCLSLLSNAVVLWNTVQIERIVTELRAGGTTIRDEDLVHVWPLQRRHITPNGVYFANRTMPTFVMPESVEA